jgi:hypothetical protein
MVVGFAAVFALQAAVVQDALLAFPPAWEQEPEQVVPQAAVAQIALPVQIAVLAARSGASPGDPQGDSVAAVCWAESPGGPQDAVPVQVAVLAARWDASRDDPQACSVAAGCSVESLGDPLVDLQADYLAVRLADDHW